VTGCWPVCLNLQPFCCCSSEFANSACDEAYTSFFFD
jgi:hypothetical protein